MIPVTDLKRPEQEIRSEIDAALARVARRGRFILGPEGKAFERAFASFCGAAHCIGVGSGTDALQIALMACGIGPGDEVITVSLTSVATVCAVERTGARPVLVDVHPETLTMDPDAIPAALTKRTRAILPVHLHGSPADLEPILRLAGENGLAVIEDCAHAHGARYRGKRAGSWGTISAFSFYPTKNLGAHGDGGAVVTDDPDLAGRARRIRQYGWDSDRISRCKGFNSRLDEMQAAVLGVKLGSLEKWNAERRALAEGYDCGLRDSGLRLPVSLPDTTHVYYTYAVRQSHRDALRKHLARNGISTAIHYPVPVHLQPAYADLGLASGSLPAAEAAARELLTLPLFPGMRRAELEQVIDAIRDFRPES